MYGNLQNPGKSPGLKWLLEHKDYPHADYCLIWPFALLNNGYGVVSCNGEPKRAHRLMCELIHGPAPTEAHVAAHSCDRGHDACVNPHHLSWKTPAENTADRKDHIGKRKLTFEQAKEIRAAKGLERPLETARRFNTTFSNVIAIWEGRTWRENKNYVSDDAVREIRGAANEWGIGEKLAKQYGISVARVYRIRKGLSYAHVPDIAEIEASGKGASK